MNRRFLRLIPHASVLIALLLLAACADVSSPTLTPAATLTGPTLEPSPTFNAVSAGDNAAEPVYEGQNNPTAAALAPGAAMPPFEVGQPSDNSGHTVKITAEDGVLLQGELYVITDVLAPGVLLLADDGASWGDFPGKLYAAGYTVLVMPVRPANALSDFHIMLQTVINGVADPARLGVVGAGGGANVALLGCAEDKLCDAVALLSPTADPALVNAMPQINPRPMLLTASQEDTEAFTTIQDLQAAATGEVLFQPFNRAGAGTGLLQNRPDLGDLIVSWLKLVLV